MSGIPGFRDGGVVERRGDPGLEEHRDGGFVRLQGADGLTAQAREGDDGHFLAYEHRRHALLWRQPAVRLALQEERLLVEGVGAGVGLLEVLPAQRLGWQDAQSRAREAADDGLAGELLPVWASETTG